MQKNEIPAVFLGGGICYLGIELLWRGTTHWSMGITGGLSAAVIYFFAVTCPEVPFWVQCITGSVFITFFELITGILVNGVFHLAVWDYSGKPINLWGQICFRYSLYWVVLSGVVIKLSRVVHPLFQKAAK